MDYKLEKFFEILYQKNESKTTLPKRCKICNKKPGLDYFQCNCDLSNIFCGEHRFPFNHSCTIEYKKLNQNFLEKNNPKIIKEKFDRI